MARIVDAAKRRSWSEHLRRFSRSRLTVTEFCEAEGVSVPSFYLWRKKISSRGQQGRAQPKQPARQSFVPLQIGATAQVEIHLPNGARVCLPSGDVQTLGAAIAAAGRLSASALEEDTAC
jgi:hypothetical protein